MEWNRRRGQLQSYLAGILDGEGCFGIYEASGTWQGRVTLEMHDPQAVLLLKRLYPKGYVAIDDENAYRVTYSHLNGWELVEEMIPFLIVKQRQAKVLRSFLVHRRRDHQVPVVGGCPRCVAFAGKIRSVRGEAKGVNSVNALLAHGLREYRAERVDVEQDVEGMLGLLAGVETRDRRPHAVEPMSAPEQEIVHAAA